MKTYLILLLLGLGVSSVHAQVNMDDFYLIDGIHSYVGFEVKYMGYAKVKGRFEKFKGSVYYKEKDIKATSVSIQVEAGSIDTDMDWRDNDLKSANWLDAEQFPTFSFVSKRIVATKNGFKVIGDLTMKGITKEQSLIMAPASGVLADIRGDSQVIFTGYTEIDRTDFGIEGKSWSKVKEGITAVDNKVKIEVSILAKQYQEANLRNFVRNPKSPPGMLYAAYKEGGTENLKMKMEALKKDSEIQVNENALNMVGNLLIRQDKLDDAQMLFELNKEYFADKSLVYTALASIYARQGQYNKAKEQLVKAIALDPNNLNAKEKLRHFN